MSPPGRLITFPRGIKGGTVGLTASEEQVWQRLNDKISADHGEATKAAIAKGQRPPAPPPSVTKEQVEFPRYMHKWKADEEHAPGHHKATESKLARNAEEMKTLLEQGFTESPTHKKDAAKKDAPKA